MTEETPLGEQLILHNGEEMKIKDIPDPFIRAMLGYGHLNPRSRSVVAVEGRTWPTTPDVCTYGDKNWEWVTAEGQTDPPGLWPIAGIQFLVCPMCGLDGT
jgi:hypothetical protein